MKKLLPLLGLLPLTLAAQNIGDFESVEPAIQQSRVQILEIPSTHTFQKLFQRDLIPLPGGITVDNFDFTGYIPSEGSSILGTLSINHETSPGGVTLLSLSFDTLDNLWNVGNNRAVDFSGVQGTVRNCSGGVTPWETVVTSEESIDANDGNGDGYYDIGWQVEIDPITGEIKDYDQDGKADKIWKMGNMSHENFAVNPAGTYAYEGADMGSTGFVYKYVLSTPNDLSDGLLYVLKLDTSEITLATSATWVAIPYSTPEECNTVLTAAEALGATNFNGVEDVEVGPDGYIYFTAKGTDRVYRFTATDSEEIEHFEIFIDNVEYYIHHGADSSLVNFQDPDNLAFDKQGNLYIQQDGGNNYLWVTSPQHSKDNPDIRIFANTPAGSESTGITFSPDGRFMFLSIQHPTQSNVTPVGDAAGSQVQFNEDITVVIARKEVLGSEATTGINDMLWEQPQMRVIPNPVVGNELKLEVPAGFAGKAEFSLISQEGRMLQQEIKRLSGTKEMMSLNIQDLPSGQYVAIVRINDIKISASFIRQ